MSLSDRIIELATRIGEEIKGMVRPDHPGLARAWVSFGAAGGAVVLRAAHNVARVERIETGKYRIHFALPMPDANYCWLAFARNAGSQRKQKIAAARATAEAKTPAFVDLIVTTTNGSLSDSSEINLVVYR